MEEITIFVDGYNYQEQYTISGQKENGKYDFERQGNGNYCTGEISAERVEELKKEGRVV